MRWPPGNVSHRAAEASWTCGPSVARPDARTPHPCPARGEDAPMVQRTSALGAGATTEFGTYVVRLLPEAVSSAARQEREDVGTESALAALVAGDSAAGSAVAPRDEGLRHARRFDRGPWDVRVGIDDRGDGAAGTRTTSGRSKPSGGRPGQDRAKEMHRCSPGSHAMSRSESRRSPPSLWEPSGTRPQESRTSSAAEPCEAASQAAARRRAQRPSPAQKRRPPAGLRRQPGRTSRRARAGGWSGRRRGRPRGARSVRRWRGGQNAAGRCGGGADGPTAHAGLRRRRPSAPAVAPRRHRPGAG